MTELLPCPFCGGEVHFTDGYPRLHRPCKNGIGVECEPCGLIFGWDCDYGGTYQDEEDAAAAWNRRAEVKSIPPVRAPSVFEPSVQWVSDGTSMKRPTDAEREAEPWG